MYATVSGLVLLSVRWDVVSSDMCVPSLIRLHSLTLHRICLSCAQVGWPGSIGALSGFSDQQLAISEIGVRILLYREHLQCVFLLATMPTGVQTSLSCGCACCFTEGVLCSTICTCVKSS
jgi:hypothetical protein